MPTYALRAFSHPQAKLVAALTPVLRVTSHPVPRIFGIRCYQHFVLALPPGREQSYLQQGLLRHLCNQILLVTSGVEFVAFGLWWCLWLFPTGALDRAACSQSRAKISLS